MLAFGYDFKLLKKATQMVDAGCWNGMSTSLHIPSKEFWN